MQWRQWEVLDLGQAKLGNHILGQVADQNYIEIPESKQHKNVNRTGKLNYVQL